MSADYHGMWASIPQRASEERQYIYIINMEHVFEYNSTLTETNIAPEN